MRLDRVANKIASNYAVGHRGDLAIADFQKITPTTAKVLIEFLPKFGKPTGSDIEGYFTKTFMGDVKPVMSSCLIKANAVSVVAKIEVETKELDSVKADKRFVPIVAGLVYLDNQLQDTWEVREDGGKKVLAKQGTEDISKIIAERKNRMFMERTPSVSLSSLDMVHANLLPGDVIKVFANEGLVDFTITDMNEDSLIGTMPGQEAPVAIQPEQVIDLVSASTEVRAASDASTLQKYYELAYGDKNYAKELVK